MVYPQHAVSKPGGGRHVLQGTPGKENIEHQKNGKVKYLD